MFILCGRIDKKNTRGILFVLGALFRSPSGLRKVTAALQLFYRGGFCQRCDLLPRVSDLILSVTISFY